MNDENSGFGLNEEEVLLYKVTDEALEAAACAGPETVMALTVAFCTGGVDCPF